LTLSLSKEDLTNEDDNEPTMSSSPTHVDGVTSPSFENDERHYASMREMICNFILGKSKALVFGQFLSLMLAGTGAIQSALYLDCHLSAPTFSMLSFYLPLSIACLARLFWRERKHVLFSRIQSSCSINQVNENGQKSKAGEVSELQNVTQQQSQQQQSSESTNSEITTKATTTTIRAKPEKRNHLLSQWSQLPLSRKRMSDEDICTFYIDGNNYNNEDEQSNANDISKAYSLFGVIPLHSPLRMYAMVAIFDVYANYTTIMAFKYTTITSVSLFDALAIPSAIILSRVVFGRRYTKIHLLGVMVCSIGIALNVFQDYREDKHLEEVSDDEESAQEEMIKEDYPHKMRGDILAIIGGTLFGISNTLQEVTVRDSTLTEYLGCMTFFASIISILQVIILERDEVMTFFRQSASDTCSISEGPILFFAFAIGGMVNYTGIGAFLQISDAAFLNLSLLTGDAWAVAFSVLGEGIVPPASFYIALAITVCGVLIYETAPSPVVVIQKDSVAGEIQLTETVVENSGREKNGLESHALA